MENYHILLDSIIKTGSFSQNYDLHIATPSSPAENPQNADLETHDIFKPTTLEKNTSIGLFAREVVSRKNWILGGVSGLVSKELVSGYLRERVETSTAESADSSAEAAPQDHSTKA